MDYYKLKKLNVDLNQPIRRVNVGGIMATGDSLADHFIIEVKRAGEPVFLSGEVNGFFISPSGETIKLKGMTSQNCATIKLEASCYEYDGAFQLAVKMKEGDGESTIAIFDGVIEKTLTETLVSGNRVVYDANKIMEIVEDMEAALTDTTAATDAANAAAERAETATDAANAAAQGADAARDAANQAATDAMDSAAAANGAASTAEEAAQRANAAATTANTSAQSASNAATEANAAKDAAQQAGQAATDAASNANAAADAANAAASTADGAADRANDAADSIDDMTVSAYSLDTGEEATAKISTENGAKNIEFGIPRGLQGERGEKGEKGDNGGFFAMEVREDGHLYALYNDGQDEPPLSINEDGRLIYTL